MDKKSKHTQQEPVQNAGTYQTGFTPPEPQQKYTGLIAVLLVVIIFLGGIASGMGLLNIRLLQALSAQNQQAMNPGIHTVPQPSSTQSQLPETELPLPELPDRRDVQLILRDLTSLQGKTAQQISQENARGMVKVLTKHHRAAYAGTGLVISSQGYILTNAHMVETASRIYVITHDGECHRARLVGLDLLTDIAVLYVNAEGLEAVEFGNSAHLSPEDPIFSDISMEGLVPGSLINLDLKVQVGSYSVPLLNTNVSGNSGPLFNDQGQVIGLNVGAVCDFFDLYVQNNNGISVPSATVKEVVDQLMARGFVAGRPSLGIRTAALDEVYQNYLKLPGGLELLEVSEFARQQGLQQGDILLNLEGRRMENNHDLMHVLLENNIGQTLTAEIFRNGETVTLSLTILDCAAGV